MNFFGISNSVSAPESVPASPEGAPRFPGEFGVSELLVFTVVFALAVMITNFQPIFTSIVVVVFSVCWWKHFSRRRLYSRIGWYERREVVIPKLPFAMHGYGERILFGTEDITLFPHRYQKQKNTRTIPYARVTGVYTQCEGICLTGVILKLEDDEIHVRIPEGREGEQTRLSLAILRAKAAQATFTGPKWVEEGWVPRTGFSSPSYSVGGSPGP